MVMPAMVGGVPFCLGAPCYFCSAGGLRGFGVGLFGLGGPGRCDQGEWGTAVAEHSHMIRSKCCFSYLHKLGPSGAGGKGVIT